MEPVSGALKLPLQNLEVREQHREARERGKHMGLHPPLRKEVGGDAVGPSMFGTETLLLATL